MFRKLVSNLAFSPALVGQIGFYAKRLRKEEATRRIGLIFTVLALVVQSFAVFSPPEAANASSTTDFINGGFSTKQEYIRNYDSNTNNIKDLFEVLDITKSDINNASWGTVNSKDVYSWSLIPRFGMQRGEKEYSVKTSNGGMRSYYYKPLSNWDSTSWTKQHGSTYSALIGKTKSGMYFALIKGCGNLALRVTPPAPKCPTGQIGTYPHCTPPPKKCTIPGKTHLDANDPQCKLDPVATCSALKITVLNDKYQLDGTSTAKNGATVSLYTYVVKRDGKVVDTIKQTSSKLSDTAFTKQTAQGSYTVELTVTTSLGAKTGPNCVKTFNIPAPKMCPVNPKLLESSPECQPCPGDETIWIKDEKCAANFITSKIARNTTQGNVDAATTTAKAGDKIVYSLNIANKGKASADITPTEQLLDVLEYAQIIDGGGATFDTSTKTLVWPTVTLKPGDTQTRMFTVQILSEIPAMNTGTSDKQSYDCRIDNAFGNTVSINVDCPVQKQIVEQTVEQLPHTGPRENMLFAGVALTVIVYFYARSRQMKKEVRLIRRDLNAGTI